MSHYEEDMYGGRKASKWNDFVKTHKGQNKTMTELSVLYRQSNKVIPRSKPSACVKKQQEPCRSSIDPPCSWVVPKALTKSGTLRRQHCRKNNGLSNGSSKANKPQLPAALPLPLPLPLRSPPRSSPLLPLRSSRSPVLPRSSTLSSSSSPRSPRSPRQSLSSSPLRQSLSSSPLWTYNKAKIQPRQSSSPSPSPSPSSEIDCNSYKTSAECRQNSCNWEYNKCVTPKQK